MAKHAQKKKRVKLTSPTGTKVTVGEGSVEKFKAKGYKSGASTSTDSK